MLRSAQPSQFSTYPSQYIDTPTLAVLINTVHSVCVDTFACWAAELLGAGRGGDRGRGHWLVTCDSDAIFAVADWLVVSPRSAKNSLTCLFTSVFGGNFMHTEIIYFLLFLGIFIDLLFFLLPIPVNLIFLPQDRPWSCFLENKSTFNWD